MCALFFLFFIQFDRFTWNQAHKCDWPLFTVNNDYVMYTKEKTTTSFKNSELNEAKKQTGNVSSPICCEETLLQCMEL